MPDKLAQYLPFLSEAERKELYGSITQAAAKPRGDPIREGVIQGAKVDTKSRDSCPIDKSFTQFAAYDDTMKIMVISATVLSIIPVLLALLMPNWYLGDQQNAVDDANLAGEPVAHEDEFDVYREHQV